MSFKEGDLVWAKVRGFPWWPGQVMDPGKAPEQARAREKPDRILIAFAGDNSFNWLLEKNVLHFGEHFQQLSQQADVPKNLAATLQLGIEEMRELADRRQGLIPATNHRPADFLDPSTLPQGCDSTANANRGGLALDDSAAVALPPTPDAAALHRCPPHAVLTWLREAARTLDGAGAGGEAAAAAAAAAATGGEGQEAAGAGSASLLVSSAQAQLAGLRKRFAKKGEPSNGGQLDDQEEPGVAGKVYRRRPGRARKPGTGAASTAAAATSSAAGPEEAAGAADSKQRGGGRKRRSSAAATTEERLRPAAAPAAGDRPKRSLRPSAVVLEAAGALPEDIAAARAGEAAPGMGRGRGRGRWGPRKVDEDWPLPGGWDTAAAELATIRRLAAWGTAGAASPAMVATGEQPQQGGAGQEHKQHPVPPQEGVGARGGREMAEPRGEGGAAPAAVTAAPANAAVEAARPEAPAEAAIRDSKPAEQLSSGSAAAATLAKATHPVQIPPEAAPHEGACLSPPTQVALLRAREALYAESSWRQHGNAGALLLSALREAASTAAKRGLQRGRVSAMAAAAGEDGLEGSSEEESDWTPPASTAAATARRRGSERQQGEAGSQGVSVEPGGSSGSEASSGYDEVEGGSAGYGGTPRKRANQAGSSGGASGRKRGGRVKGGVPVELPESSDGSFRQFDYAGRVPPTREAFLEALAAFYAAKNGRMGEPTIDKQPVDLYAILKEVAAQGGYEAVTAKKAWRQVLDTWRSATGKAKGEGEGEPEGEVKPSKPSSSAATLLRNQYVQYLLAFEHSLQEGLTPTTVQAVSPGGRRGGGPRKRDAPPPSAKPPGGGPASPPGKASGSAVPMPKRPKMEPGSKTGPSQEPLPSVKQEPGAVGAAGGRRPGSATGSAAAAGAAAAPAAPAGASPAPRLPPLIPKKAPPAQAVSGPVSAAQRGGRKKVLVLRFPAQYASMLPSKAQVETKIKTAAKGVEMVSVDVYVGPRTAIILFADEANAKAAYEAVRNRAGQLFNMPQDSVTVVWDEWREKQAYQAAPAATAPQQAEPWPSQQAQQPHLTPPLELQQAFLRAQQALPPPVPEAMPPVGFASFMTPAATYSYMALQAQQGQHGQHPQQGGLAAPADPRRAPGGMGPAFGNVPRLGAGPVPSVLGQTGQGVVAGQPGMLDNIHGPPGSSRAGVNGGSVGGAAQQDAGGGQVSTMDLMSILQAAGMAPPAAASAPMALPSHMSSSGAQHGWEHGSQPGGG
ncbi:hypothetical protein N2152v2_002275 [Parachlorella kessleri]